jgi:hypothetical protein
MIILWDKDNHMFCHSYSGEHTLDDCKAALLEYNNMMEGRGLGRPYIEASNQNAERTGVAEAM